MIFNFKHDEEKMATGIKRKAVLAGLIDQSYQQVGRGEIV